MGSLGTVLKNLKGLMERVDVDYVFVGDLPVMYFSGKSEVMDVHVKFVNRMQNPSLLKSTLRGNGYEVTDEDFQNMIANEGVLNFEDKDAMVTVTMSLVSDEFDALVFRERLYVKVDGVSVPIASSETMIVHKLRTGNPFDLLDAQALFRNQRGMLAMHKVEKALKMAGMEDGDYKTLLEAGCS